MPHTTTINDPRDSVQHDQQRDDNDAKLAIHGNGKLQWEGSYEMSQ